MKRVKWLCIGCLLAVLIGFLLVKLWSMLAGIVVAVVVLVALAVGGPFWEVDEDDDDDDEDRD